MNLASRPAPASPQDDVAERLVAQAAALTGFGAWECDLATLRLTWTDAVYDLFALKRGSQIHRADTVSLYEPDSRRQMDAKRAAMIAGAGSFVMDAQLCNAAGELRWMRLAARAVHENGRTVRIFGSKQDITQEKRLWQELSALAHSDPMTGLANRRAFEASFAEFARAARDGHGGVSPTCAHALVLIDLDHFKQVNDHYGHAAGDACLQQMATRLARIFADAAIVARLGGDEFAVLLRLPQISGLRGLLAQACHGLATPIPWRNENLALSVSIGAAMIGGGQASDPALVFAKADAALYVAKAAGRNRAHIHGDALTPQPGLVAIRSLLDSG